MGFPKPQASSRLLFCPHLHKVCRERDGAALEAHFAGSGVLDREKFQHDHPQTPKETKLRRVRADMANIAQEPFNVSLTEVMVHPISKTDQDALIAVTTDPKYTKVDLGRVPEIRAAFRGSESRSER